MAMKRFGVNVTRTITLDQTVYVMAQNADAAQLKVEQQHAAGKAGDPYVEFKGAKGIWADAEGGEINEHFEVEDAYQEDED